MQHFNIFLKYSIGPDLGLIFKQNFFIFGRNNSKAAFLRSDLKKIVMKRFKQSWRERKKVNERDEKKF